MLTKKILKELRYASFENVFIRIMALNVILYVLYLGTNTNHPY